MEKWHHDVGPRVFATLEKLKKQSAWCIPRLSGESKYEVKCFGGTQPGRPKKSRISSTGEPSSSSNPKAKHLPRYHHKGKRRQQLKARDQVKELQDNQGRNS
ncbi:uncharacterized protein Pyn_26108 [Prunus yedoensis var. nudiflora]|uniref:Uncharacterized protein n=1 Tax=Prunus yedoensis var. nudiflora TaxID=2094558 RepID=A0A314Y301_PRUYE|nr:uncharacterized protein Pyn_26108 [Prunus yedoensis var. nudiflora]